MKFELKYNSDKSIQDIEITIQDKSFLMLGSSGARRELSVLQKYAKEENKEVLPVFIGIGLGFAIEEFLENTKEQNLPICIIDKEDFIDNSNYSSHIAKILENDRVYLIREKEYQKVLKKVTEWQNLHNNLPLLPLLNNQYSRIDNAFYKELDNNLAASLKFDFWAKARKKRFQTKETTLLLIASKYFLMGEVVSACTRLNIKHKLLILEDDSLAQDEFISLLLQNVIELQPDAILTMNHLGLDREGILTDLLERLELPLISWFVDNPHLVVYNYPKIASEWLTLFTYDMDNIPSLNEAGYNHVHYMPLGTDPERFNPRNKDNPIARVWKSEVSFVGNSMRAKVVHRLEGANPPRILRKEYKNIASAYIDSPMHSVKEFIQKEFPQLYEHFENLPGIEEKLAFETLITWEATRKYRYDCFAKTFEFSPTIVGDPFWHSALRGKNVKYKHFDALSYYDQLPYFYPQSKINFNSTSMQMKNAINQRIFDVPATNSFVLTDWRSQMDGLLESGKEIISYKEKEEIPDLIHFYLKNDTAREKIVEAGRKRVLAEHTWECRLVKMIEIMQKRYR